jgi:diguanylate cyclase (GGDEF)-like protein
MRKSDWRFSYRILFPVLLAGAAAVLLAIGLLFFATRETDDLAQERQGQLVSHVLGEQLARLSHDQESVTLWDDAIRNTSHRFDFEWVEVNLGVWMYDYFGHDHAFVLNGENAPIYAMAAGASAEPSTYASAERAIEPLVSELREMLRIAAPGETTSDVTRFRAADLVTVDGRPAIASVLPIVSDSGEIVQEPGREYLHVAVRFLDGSILQDLMQSYLLDGARFSWTNDAAPRESAFPLVRRSGETLGYFIWQPERPGWHLARRAMPLVVIALLVVGSIVLWLTRRLRLAWAELQASEAHALHLAFRDPLTGLPNRALFNDRLDRTLTEARQTGTRLALLSLDLDRFKSVNDTLGHPAGDDLIRELAGRLTELLRGTDCIARFGGDEFAVLQTDVASIEDVEALCRRIIQTAGRPFELLGKFAFVGVSIGVAIVPDAGVDRAELMRKADIALYRAKAEGRNQFRIFADEMDQFVRRRREIEAELRHALGRGEQLCVQYQPLFAVDSPTPVGLEALLRWDHPQHGLIPPAVFIPIAEETGLMQAIGEWVLRTACAVATRWPAATRLAVNVSAVQFRSEGFAETVLEILRDTGLEPSRLELEVTESLLLDNAELSARTFGRLRAAGVRIALDDFGTGYSSLNYLNKFAVDKIKIDRSFVQSLDSSAASDAIVQAMVDLAKAVGVEVTAEGVETDGQREFLRSVGCDEMQGFLLSRPLWPEQVDRLLEIEAGAQPAPAVASAA